MSQGSVVIVGSGIMGCGIAALFLRVGWKIQMMARSADKWPQITRNVGGLLKQIDPHAEQAGKCAELLGFCTAIEQLEWTDVSLVIETVVEDKAVKQALFRDLDSIVPVSVPIATNTSGFRITDLAENCPTRQRMAHAHFFMPAHLVPLVELAPAGFTDETAVDKLQQVFEDIGCVPVRIKRDVPGLLANRIQHALTREALSVIQSGLASAEDVDKAVRFGFGFRYVAAGPILQKEMSGLDTLLASAAAVYPSLCNDTEPAQVLRQAVREGHTGMKSGKGFRDWPDDKARSQSVQYEKTLLAAAKLLKEN